MTILPGLLGLCDSWAVGSAREMIEHSYTWQQILIEQVFLLGLVQFVEGQAVGAVCFLHSELHML